MELVFQRTSVHLQHDVPRLEAGDDINDALLDFFAKLGQALVPRRRAVAENGSAKCEELPPVAYLGSLFFDVLTKGGVEDGRAGHANVANWARKRLGKDGLFADGVGALAVPVNELLNDERGAESEKHWWLALLLNPRGGRIAQKDEKVSVLCLDSFARVGAWYSPPMRQQKPDCPPTCFIEVTAFSRVGFIAIVNFRAETDGDNGAIPDPRMSKLSIGGREFKDPIADVNTLPPSGEGEPVLIQGILEFGLNSTVRMVGEYLFDYGGTGEYGPPLRFVLTRETGPCQENVVGFLGGYLARESEVTAGPLATAASAVEEARITDGLRLVDVPQQECAHDCGYFMLEHFLRTLHLSPEALRALATASTWELANMPWPSQDDIHRKKMKLRTGLKSLFVAAKRLGTSDVEVLFREDPSLHKRMRKALRDGGLQFARAVKQWMAALGKDGVEDAPEEPEESEDEEEEHARSTIENGNADSRQRGRSSSRSSSRSRSRSCKRRRRSRSDSREGVGEVASDGRSPGKIRFTMSELQGLPSMTLRGLCLQRGLIPSGTTVVDRAQLLKALAPHAATARSMPGYSWRPTQPQAPSSAAAPGPTKAPSLQPPPVAKPPPPTGPKAPTLSSFLRPPEPDKPAKVAPSTSSSKFSVSRPPSVKPPAAVEAAAAAIAAARTAQQPAVAPEKPSRRLDPLPAFTREELDKLPLKTLRAYCMQAGRLPGGAVERADFVQALLPLASSGPGKSSTSAVAAPQRPKTQSPASSPAPAAVKAPTAGGGDLPSKFSKKDLEGMSVKVLKNLCVKHGVLPKQMPVEKSDLVKALRAFATT